MTQGRIAESRQSVVPPVRTPVRTPPATRHGRAAHRRGVGGPLARGGGRRDRLRHPRRRGAAGLRPAAGLHQGPARAGPARAGRRARGHRVCAGHRQGRGLHGDLRSRRHQPGHPDRRRADGLRADGRHHRPGRPRDDRHRRLPGGRHLRHHDADHQTQLPGHRSGRDPTNDRGRVPPGSDRPTRRRAGGHPEGRAAVGDHLRLAAGRPSPGLPADHAAALGTDHRRRQADRRRASSGALRRWWGVEGPGDRGPSTAGRADRNSGRHHAHGPRRLPGFAHPAPGDARDARHRGGSGGHAARGRHRRARRPVRRSGHRPAFNVRARRDDHPRRHRPGRDRQEPGGRRADRR